MAKRFDAQLRRAGRRSARRSDRTCSRTSCGSGIALPVRIRDKFGRDHVVAISASAGMRLRNMCDDVGKPCRSCQHHRGIGRAGFTIEQKMSTSGDGCRPVMGLERRRAAMGASLREALSARRRLQARSQLEVPAAIEDAVGGVAEAIKQWRTSTSRPLERSMATAVARRCFSSRASSLSPCRARSCARARRADALVARILPSS